MNKKDLIDAVASVTGFTKKDVSQVVDTVFTTIADAMSKRIEVSIPGFGKFTTVDRAARTGVNPKTGEKINIAAKTSPKFKPSTPLRAAVAGA